MMDLHHIPDEFTARSGQVWCWLSSPDVTSWSCHFAAPHRFTMIYQVVDVCAKQWLYTTSRNVQEVIYGAWTIGLFTIDGVCVCEFKAASL